MKKIGIEVKVKKIIIGIKFIIMIKVYTVLCVWFTCLNSTQQHGVLWDLQSYLIDV